MKKFLFAFICLLLSVSINAQIGQDLSKSKERAANLEKLCANYPTKCGNSNIDNYGKSIYDAALAAIHNSDQLENLYKRQIGETKDGVTDVSIKKPALEDWVKLSTTIAAESVSIKNAVDNTQKAAKEVKEISESAAKEKNPMKLAKAAKTAKAASAILEFGNSATPVLLEESAAQVKAIQTIIKTLQSGANL